jgi:hypothetical protein
MTTTQTVAVVPVGELFSCAGIERTGTANWGDRIPERGPGVYVISIADPSLVTVESLPESDRRCWISDQPIIYIGRGVQLSRRLSQFYRHEYGKRSPHRGGQAILNVGGLKRIDWAAVNDYASAEHRLIAAFEAKTGQKPFGNRVRPARLAQTKAVQA